MVKAAALYIVIIIALLIAIISVSLLTIAFFYRLEMQKSVRRERLTRNLESGTAILLSKDYKVSDTTLIMDLFDQQSDSVSLSKERWGVYEVNAVAAFALQDTLKNAFLSGRNYTDKSAIYLADEDRPLSLSGNTRITGDGEFPKSGIRQAYVDGKAYSGKTLIQGQLKNSGRLLPVVDKVLMDSLLAGFKKVALPFPADRQQDFSFFRPAVVYTLKSNQCNLAGMQLSGKLKLIADTTVHIGADTQLEDIQIYAPSIVIDGGFTGSCQLFARDSIIMGKRCNLKYPSFAGVFKADTSKLQSKIGIGAGSKFSGILFSHEAKRTELQTIISIGKDCLIKGQVYATGFIQLEKPVEVNGKVYAHRFIMRTPATLYENYLIDVVLNSTLLSRYYLTSALIAGAGSSQQVLKWLN